MTATETVQEVVHDAENPTGTQAGEVRVSCDAISKFAHEVRKSAGANLGTALTEVFFLQFGQFDKWVNVNFDGLSRIDAIAKMEFHIADETKEFGHPVCRYRIIEKPVYSDGTVGDDFRVI